MHRVFVHNYRVGEMRDIILLCIKDNHEDSDNKCSAKLPSFELQVADSIHGWGMSWHRVRRNSRLPMVTM